jgi:hypothetical protein
LAISLTYPSGEEEDIFYSFKLFLPAFATLRGGGGLLCKAVDKTDNKLRLKIWFLKKLWKNEQSLFATSINIRVRSNQFFAVQVLEKKFSENFTKTNKLMKR